MVHSWVGEHVWVTQRMRENAIHPCQGLVAFLWSGKGAGQFSSPMLLKSGRIPRWRSLLLVWFGPAAFKQFNHSLELSWSLALPPFPLIFPLVEPRERDFQMQSITYGRSTPIPIKLHRNLYVLHFKHQGNRYGVPLSGRLWSYGASTLISSTATVALTPGNEHRQGDKRWTDLMHGRDTAVPSNLSRLKSTQIRHYCLTRNYRLHCRSKEKRTNPDRIHNNYFTCLEEHENGSTDTSVCGGNVVFIGSGVLSVMSEWGRLVMFYWER